MKEFETVLKPKSKLFDLRIKEVFKYRDLIGLFVRRDFVAKYKQTILGPLWAIISPLITSGIFTLIFGSLAGLVPNGLSGLNMFLFFFLPTICWQFFAHALQTTSVTFVANSHILGKVYFPRLVMPISSVLSGLISFAIQFLLFLIVYFITYFVVGGVEINIYALILPLAILQLGLLGLGVGIIISALTTKYRDLALLVNFGVQVWLYLSPIAYDISIIPESVLSIYMLNPIAPIVNNLRYGFFGVGSINLTYTLISVATTIVLLIFGLLIFNKVEKNFADTI